VLKYAIASSPRTARLSVILIVVGVVLEAVDRPAATDMTLRVGPCSSCASGIIVRVGSSKRARRRRRQAAQARHYKRLRKAGRLPRHTRAERRRAASERARQREADQRRERLIGRVMPPLAMGVAVPAFVFLGSSGPVVTGAHHWYPMVSAAPFGGVGLPAGPDMPHLPDPGMTYYTPMVTANAM
jgi:hypothetical protein